MKIESTHLENVFLITADSYEDSRGSFSPLIPEALEFKIHQINTVYNPVAGTLRGLHRQKFPHEQRKLVTSDKLIYDVVLHKDTDEWGRFEIQRGKYLLIGKDYFHGYIVTEPAQVNYYLDAPFVAEAEEGRRWDNHGIDWGIDPILISDKDVSWDL